MVTILAQPSVVPVNALKVVNVSTIPAMMSALTDNTVDVVQLANGTYTVDVAQNQTTNSMWCGSAYNARTRPVTARPATPGGVTFTGAGNYGLSFADGATQLTFDGFHFANMTGSIIGFGGFTPTPPPHHITLRNITLESTCRRASSASTQEQGIYLANALTEGPYNILLEDITVDGTDALCVWAAIHGYHGDSTNPAPHHVTIRRLTVNGCLRPVIMWYDTSGSNMHDWLIESATITNATEYAVQYESVGGTAITLKDMTSTGSGIAGFFSSQGANPSGVTKINDSFA